MRTILFALFLYSALALSNPFFPEEDGVVVLTDNNFEQALYEFDYALVEFYAPWCGYCQKFVSIYAEAAQILAQTRPDVKLCKMDATVEKATAKKYEVRGYPTIMFFVKGRKNPLPFDYVQTVPEIVDWITKKAGVASEEIRTVEDAEALIADKEVVAFFFGSSDSDAFKAYLSVANNNDQLVYANTNEQAIKDKYEVSNEDTIVLFKKFDEGRNTFTGPFDSESIVTFLDKHRYPTIIPFAHRYAHKLFGNNEVMYLITDASEAGTRAREAFTEVVHDIKGKIALCVAAVGEPMVDMLMGMVGVPKEGVPAIRIYKPSSEGGNKKFAFESEITGHNIKGFVEDFVNQKIKPFFKSEPISEVTHEDNVRVVVGKNFEEIVLGEDNDVLMVYYAPLGLPYKQMAPAYASLANSLKDVEGLVIGKMDLTKNEAESLKTKGFPTIRFYPKGSKNDPIEFEGEKTEEELLEFIKKHTTVRHHKLGKKIDTEL